MKNLVCRDELPVLVMFGKDSHKDKRKPKENFIVLSIS